MANLSLKIADTVTAFAGCMKFVYLHAVWFGVWIALNLGLLGASHEFDKFPFGLLTMIVSLEAIFLTTFVMISQRSQSEKADARAEADYQVNQKAEAGIEGLKLGLAQIKELIKEKS